jgi:predicted nucleotidyltransferase
LEPRERVAKEAARLLYIGASEEYKHAKEEAARSLGVNSMPSNYEVAIELDLLAEETEGDERRRLLIEMRRAALNLMQDLAHYGPMLMGSVWRGTARKGSDVDITVYADRPEEVVSRLVQSGYRIVKSEDVTAVRRGRTSRSRHINVELSDGFEAEVVVRPLRERGEGEICEIYGDPKRGLGLTDLEKLMKTDPLRKFVPRRRYR